MFRSRVFASPDAFHVALEYGHNETPGHSSSSCSSKEKVRLPVSSARLELDWSSAEPEQQVVERFVRLQSRLLQQHTHERVALHLDVEPIPNAATFPHQSLTVQLAVACSPPVLRSIHFTRTSGSGNASETLVSALLAHTALDGVWKLRGCEGLGHFWATCVQAPGDWRSLKSLNLSSCGLGVLPAAVGQLGGLRVLRLNHNKLVSLTPELGLLTELEVLSANHNQLVTLPAELRRCCRLRELHLEHNRLVTPLLDLTHATCLASLQLYGNPLDYLPELGPALGLRSLSLANVRILADAAYSRWEVEVTAASSSYTSMVIGARSHKLQPLFNLVFRRSNIQHPLLMGALSRLVEEPGNLQLLVREDVALQQLVLAALGSSSLVVGQAVKVMAAAGSYAGAARRLVRHNVVQAITDLVASQDVSLQLSGLSVLSSLSAGAAEGEVAGEVLVPTQLLDRLLALIRQHDTHEQVRALVCSNASADAAYVKLMAGLNRHLFCVVICLLLSACYPTCCWESFLLLGAWQVKGYSESIGQEQVSCRGVRRFQLTTPVCDRICCIATMPQAEISRGDRQQWDPCMVKAPMVKPKAAHELIHEHTLTPPVIKKPQPWYRSVGMSVCRHLNGRDVADGECVFRQCKLVKTNKLSN